MRPAAIAFTGLIFLVLIFGSVIYIQLALLVLSVILCLPIAAGFAWQGHKAQFLSIPTGGIRGPDDPKPSKVRIEGREFLVQNLPPRLEFNLRCRNRAGLCALVGIAVGSTVISLAGLPPQPLSADSSRYYEFYFLCYLMGVLLVPATIWLAECTLFRVPQITFARVGAHTRSGGFGTRWVTYQFTDPNGGYQGGSTIELQGPKNDDLKLVFFSKFQPGFSKVSSGLLFHEIVWANPSPRVTNA